MRRFRRIEATSAFAYLDSSALVKLVLEEPESRVLEDEVRSIPLASSEIAVVEVMRACKHAARHGEQRARQLLESTFLVEVRRPLLEHAARLTSDSLRSLDAIHLATALEIVPDEFVAYDRRLLAAAAEAGLRVVSPGA